MVDYASLPNNVWHYLFCNEPCANWGLHRSNPFNLYSKCADDLFVIPRGTHHMCNVTNHYVMRINAWFMSADLVRSHALWSQEVSEEASLSSISRKLHQFLQAIQWHFLRYLLRASQNPNLPKLKYHRNQCLQSQQLKKNQLQRLLLSRRKV